MRSFFLLLTLLCAPHALAQSDAGVPAVTPGEPSFEGEYRMHEPGAEFRWQAPAPVGSCVGGSCAIVPAPPAVAHRSLVLSEPGRDPRARFARTGAALGVVSAGLVLGSAIAIAVVDDVASERITRGVWLGYFALSTGVVALSAHLGHRSFGAASESSKGTRSVGWTAFTLALADGAVLWAGAFKGFTQVDALTIGAGAIGACALLAHALDAYVVGRALGSRSWATLQPSATGLRVRF